MFDSEFNIYYARRGKFGPSSRYRATLLNKSSGSGFRLDPTLG